MKYLTGTAGLPNAGKSSFAKMLSLSDIEIGSYPFTTLKPKEIVSFYFSPELEKLHKITQTKEVKPGMLHFLDVPGLIRGAHKGEGLGNEFLSYLRGCDAIIEIVRTFRDQRIPHPENSIDPERDLLIIEEEILQAEKNYLENILVKLRKQNKEEKIEILEQIKDNLKPFARFPEYQEELKEFGFLITKPWYILWNGDEKGNKPDTFVGEFVLDLWYELEVLEKPELLSIFPSKKQLFLDDFRQSLGFLQCFTFTKEITQLWLVKRGTRMINFAYTVHSNFGEKFKFAEVLSLEDFIEVKNWDNAHELGLIKKRGKDDLVQENDIILIKI